MRAGWLGGVGLGAGPWSGLLACLVLTVGASCSLDRSPVAAGGRDDGPRDAATGTSGDGGSGGVAASGGAAGVSGAGGTGGGGAGGLGGSGGLGGVGGSGGSGGSGGMAATGGSGGSSGTGGTGGTQLAPNGCRSSDNCQTLGAFGNVCVESTGLPKACIMASDCAAYGAGVPCAVLPFGLYCVVGCTP